MAGLNYNELMGEVSIKAAEMLEAEPEITLDELYSAILDHFGLSGEVTRDVYVHVNDVYKGI